MSDDSEFPIALVIQFRLDVDGIGDLDMLDRRWMVQEFVQGILQESDNGTVDGGDMGGGTANVFCYVRDGDRAVEGIVGELGGMGLTPEKTNIATRRVDTVEPFTIVWPPARKGEPWRLFGDK